MSLSRSPNLQRINPPAPSHLSLLRATEASKLRAKRTAGCKTCEGKVCVGRCRFEKIH
jgi:hypothetical protein